MKAKPHLVLVLLLIITSCGREVKKEHYPDGSLYLKYEVKNGKKHGLYKSFYKNGNLKHKGKYRSGKRHGKHIWLTTKEDTKTVSEYRNGSLHGISKKFYSNGVLKCKMIFDNGNRIGVTKTFYDDGSKKGVIEYSKGTRTGEDRFYYKSGELKAKSHTVKDSVIFYQEYDKAGDTIETLRDLVIIGPDTLRASDEKYVAKAYLGGMKKDTAVMMRTRVVSAENYETSVEKGWAISIRDTTPLKNGVGRITFVPDSPVLPSYFIMVNLDYEGGWFHENKAFRVEHGKKENYSAYRDSSSKQRGGSIIGSE